MSSSILGALNASLSGSKLVWGTAAIVASLGSRFIIGELTPAQQGVLKSVAFKRAALFAMLFLPTRDLLLSAALTVVVSVLLESLFNETSSYCVLPECLRERGGIAPVPPPTLPLASRAALLGPAASAAPRRRKHVRFAVNGTDDDYGNMLGL
jgi:hypothetical protein